MCFGENFVKFLRALFSSASASSAVCDISKDYFEY